MSQPSRATAIVDNDEFLTRLQDLLTANISKGSVWITQKRLTFDQPQAIQVDEEEQAALNDDVEGPSSSSGGQTWPCVIKASDGMTKFTTHVFPAALPAFTLAYGTLLKASFAPHLRKRDKKKEKARAEDAAKERRLLEALLAAGIGSDEGKRGKGRGRRQAKIRTLKNAQAKLEQMNAREEAKRRTIESATS